MTDFVKRLVIILFSFFLFAGKNAVAQHVDTALSICLQTGSATCLSDFIGNAIAMTVGEERGTYSHAQAEMMLQNFFKKNSPKTFKLAQSNTNHLIGILNTEKGTYRIFIAITTQKNKYQLQEIRFEK